MFCGLRLLWFGLLLFCGCLPSILGLRLLSMVWCGYSVLRVLLCGLWVVCQVALASVLVTLTVCWLWLFVIVFVNGCLIVLVLWFFIEVFSWLFGICLFNFFMFGWYVLNWLGLAWVFLDTWFCILFLALVLCWALVPGFVGANVCGFL